MDETQGEREERQRRTVEQRGRLLRLLAILSILIGMVTAMGSAGGMAASFIAGAAMPLWGGELWSQLSGTDVTSRAYQELSPFGTYLLYFLMGLLFVAAGVGISMYALWGRCMGIFAAGFCLGLTAYNLFGRSLGTPAFVGWQVMRALFAIGLVVLLNLPRLAREFSRA